MSSAGFTRAAGVSLGRLVIHDGDAGWAGAGYVDGVGPVRCVMTPRESDVHHERRPGACDARRARRKRERAARRRQRAR